jgi:hypothetical protein
MSNFQKYFLIFLLCQFATSIVAQRSDYQKKVDSYIKKYQQVAINEMALFKIPASITLAQGIIESTAGTSKLAQNANNHFGIKCHKEWMGKTFFQDDDAENECFRKYVDAIESYRDHSHFLTSRDRYKGLFELNLTDYKGWARGLKSAGYATNPQYADLLIKTIEAYKLNQFDKISDGTLRPDTIQASDVVLGSEVQRGFELVGKGPADRDIFRNNRRKVIISRSDDNIYLIARDFNIDIATLLTYNDLAFATSLKPGQIVYLESKRRRGSVASHTFRQGELLYEIAQQYGIKLKMIYKRNNLHDLVEPKPGTVLKLR